MHNFLIASFGSDALDIDDVDPATFTVDNGGLLTITHSIFATDNTFSDDDNPVGFLESTWATDPMKSNTFPGPGADGLKGRALPGLDVSLGDGAQALSGAVVPADDGFFDPSPTFIGACGCTCPDFEGWTDFPVE